MNFYSKHGFSIPISMCLKHLTSMEKDFIITNCLRKVKYRRKNEAIKKCHILKTVSPERSYGIYKCKFCDGYHVTSHMGTEDITKLNSTQRLRRRIRYNFRNMGYINEPIEIC